jgi:hypothetical protein
MAKSTKGQQEIGRLGFYEDHAESNPAATFLLSGLFAIYWWQLVPLRRLLTLLHRNPSDFVFFFIIYS